MKKIFLYSRCQKNNDLKAFEFDSNLRRLQIKGFYNGAANKNIYFIDE